jgi:ketosteroid isomerase-like protein
MPVCSETPIQIAFPRVFRVFRGSFFLLALATTLPALAQPARAPGASAELLAEINRDIWTPFAKAYEAGDVEAYLRLHRADFVRGEGNRKRVSNLEEYSRDMRAFFAAQKERGARFTVAFRFTERLARAGMAHERGIFAFTLHAKEGPPRASYGKFHTVARKDGGTWRLVVDYDSNEGATIDEAAFMAGAAADDLARFTN